MRRAMLTSLLLTSLAGCHATTTRAQDESTSPRPEPTAAAAKPPRAKKPAMETLTTSRTTKAMFKPEGLKLLQRALTQPETGLLDAPTQQALLAFQTERHLPRTGLPDFETLRLLGVKPNDFYQHEPPAARLGVP